MRFSATMAEGAALSLTEAVAYASRGRGQRNRPNTGWPALTAAELQIATLVAEGLTNPQIAKRLFISRNTVKTHLRNIFTKLDISTRSELASAAARRQSKASPKSPLSVRSDRPSG
jgi:DNA-binding CsgD family transcriptional regulator